MGGLGSEEGGESHVGVGSEDRREQVYVLGMRMEEDRTWYRHYRHRETRLATN